MSEHAYKKSNIFVRMFIPARGDSKGNVIRKIISLLCIIVAIVCAAVVIPEYVRRDKDAGLINDLEDMMSQNASGSFSIAQQEVEQIKSEVPEIMDKFIDLYSQNSDIVGWLRVAGGEYINYPVLMNEKDTDYYLHRDFNKEESIAGSLFCDNHVLPFTDANNLLIYGHNMAGSKEYFSTLVSYDPYSTAGGGHNMDGDFISYYKQYPTIQFDTLWEEGTYKIFAGIYINTEDKDGYPYPYYKKRQFLNELEFMDFMGNIMDRSTFYTGVDVEYGDQIITLSTCCYTIGKDVDARFALFARKVREGESAEVDVSKIVINPDPLFFDAYYQRRGGSWGGRTWDVDYPWLVTGFEEYTDIIDSLDNKEPESNRT